MEQPEKARKLRPSNPLVQFFQEALISYQRDSDEDWDTRESFLREKAAENNVSPTEAATAKQIATFLARTPTALVEIRRKIAEEDEGEVEVVADKAFVIPAYGDYLEAAREHLEEEGYTLEYEAEGETGAIRGIAFDHPTSDTIVTIRLYEMLPLAQGPHGLKEMVKIYAEALDGVAEKYLSGDSADDVQA